MESRDSGTVSWITPTDDKPITVTKWKVKQGSRVGKGTLLCLYETGDKKNLKLKSSMVGTVLETKEDFIPGRYNRRTVALKENNRDKSNENRSHFVKPSIYNVTFSALFRVLYLIFIFITRILTSKIS